MAIQSKEIKPPEVVSENEELSRKERDFAKEAERRKLIVLKEKSNNGGRRRRIKRNTAKAFSVEDNLNKIRTQEPTLRTPGGALPGAGGNQEEAESLQVLEEGGSKERERNRGGAKTKSKKMREEEKPIDQLSEWVHVGGRR